MAGGDEFAEGYFVKHTSLNISLDDKTNTK